MKTVPVTATPFRIIKLRSRVVHPSYSTRTKYDITIINSWVVVSTQKLATQNHILCNDQAVMGPTTFKRSLSEYQHTSMLTLDMQLLLLDLSESSESHQTIEPCQCLFINEEKYLYAYIRQLPTTDHFVPSIPGSKLSKINLNGNEEQGLRRFDNRTTTATGLQYF